MSARVSYIIPAYNIEDYIGKCLDSILNQTYTDYEVIVVNDGSTDKTGQVIDSYVLKDNRIRVLHKENQGVSAARNDGIDMATGQLILFWDGDDFAEPDTCEKLVRMIDENQADTVVYGYYRYKDGQVFETNPPRFDKTIYEGLDITREMVPAFVGISYDNVNGWLSGKKDAFYVENPALWRIMVSRDIIVSNKLRFDTRLKVGEDTVFISDYLSCSKKCFVTQECFYYLVTRETSTIFVYEKNPMQKFQGKANLLDGREDLNKRILDRTGIDIRDKWAGTVVMSAVEVGFLMAGHRKDLSLAKRYRAYKSYLSDPRTKQMVAAFNLGKNGGIKRIPFIFLKMKAYMLLFMAIACLKMINYEFER